jgi:hypothetical protein
MYKRKKGGYFNAIGGIFAGAAATALGSLLLVIFNLGSSINILPKIHKTSIVTTTIKDFMILAFLSVLLAVAAASVMRLVDKKIADED